MAGWHTAPRHKPLHEILGLYGKAKATSQRKISPHCCMFTGPIEIGFFDQFSEIDIEYQVLPVSSIANRKFAFPELRSMDQAVFQHPLAGLRH